MTLSVAASGDTNPSDDTGLKALQNICRQQSLSSILRDQKYRYCVDFEKSISTHR